MARPISDAEQEMLDLDAATRRPRRDREAPACEVQSIARSDPPRFRIVSPPGWRFGGEQLDPHVVTYRSDAPGWPLTSPQTDAAEAARDLQTWLERCACARCEDA